MLIHIIIEKCVFLWENSCVYIINNVGLIEYSDSIFYCSYNRTNIDNIDKKKENVITRKLKNCLPLFPYNDI